MNYIDISLNYFSLADKFFNLSKSSSMMIVNNQNSHSVLSDRPLSYQEIDKATEWSDINLSVPILFNFYHGLELTIKGILYLQNEGNIRLQHKFSELISDIKIEFIGEDFYNLITSLTIYITENEESIFSAFLKANDVNIDQWYEFLKYPFLRNSKEIDFITLKYGSYNTIYYWNNLANKCEEITKMSANLFYKYENKSRY